MTRPARPSPKAPAATSAGALAGPRVERRSATRPAFTRTTSSSAHGRGMPRGAARQSARKRCSIHTDEGEVLRIGARPRRRCAGASIRRCCRVADHRDGTPRCSRLVTVVRRTLFSGAARSAGRPELSARDRERVAIEPLGAPVLRAACPFGHRRLTCARRSHHRFRSTSCHTARRACREGSGTPALRGLLEQGHKRSPPPQPRSRTWPLLWDRTGERSIADRAPTGPRLPRRSGTPMPKTTSPHRRNKARHPAYGERERLERTTEPTGARYSTNRRHRRTKASAQ